MKMQIGIYLGIAVIAGSVAAAGCGRQSGSESSETPGVAERSGAALDRAADRTGEAVRSAGEATKDATGRALERTGEAMESVGESLERTGSKMQSEEPEVITEECRLPYRACATKPGKFIATVGHILEDVVSCI